MRLDVQCTSRAIYWRWIYWLNGLNIEYCYILNDFYGCSNIAKCANAVALTANSDAGKSKSKEIIRTHTKSNSSSNNNYYGGNTVSQLWNRENERENSETSEQSKHTGTNIERKVQTKANRISLYSFIEFNLKKIQQDNEMGKSTNHKSTLNTLRICMPKYWMFAMIFCFVARFFLSAGWFVLFFGDGFIAYSLYDSKNRHKLPTWYDFLAICRCAFRTLPRSTNGKFSSFFFIYSISFCCCCRCCFFRSYRCYFFRFSSLSYWCAMPMSERPQTTRLMFVGKRIFIIGNAFRTKKECVVYAAVQVNLLKMFIPIHLSGAMLRFYHHRCVTAIFFPYILHSYFFFGWVFFSINWQRQKNHIIVVDPSCTFFHRSLLTPSLINAHTMCNEWQLYPSYPFLSVMWLFFASSSF